MSKDRNSLAYNVSNLDIQGKIGHKLTIVQYKNLFEFNDFFINSKFKKDNYNTTSQSKEIDKDNLKLSF